MLLPDNVHPENTLVYNGALIVSALRRIGDVSLMELFLSARQESNLSMAIFVLSLDWLFLADCVTINDKGQVSLCS